MTYFRGVGMFGSAVLGAHLGETRPVQSMQAAQVLQQALANLNRILTLHAHAQQNREQFRIAQRLRSQFSQPFSRPVGLMHIRNSINRSRFFYQVVLVGPAIPPRN